MWIVEEVEQATSPHYCGTVGLSGQRRNVKEVRELPPLTDAFTETLCELFATVFENEMSNNRGATRAAVIAVLEAAGLSLGKERA